MEDVLETGRVEVESLVVEFRVGVDEVRSFWWYRRLMGVNRFVIYFGGRIKKICLIREE